jgi:PhzF family phenazine biosynthesis protein
MELTLWQVDAFAEKPFEGNPAAVVPLAEWIADDLMQSIAAENNLSETAFFVPDKAKGSGHYRLRWSRPPSRGRVAAMRLWRALMSCSSTCTRSFRASSS